MFHTMTAIVGRMLEFIAVSSSKGKTMLDVCENWHVLCQTSVLL